MATEAAPLRRFEYRDKPSDTLINACLEEIDTIMRTDAASIVIDGETVSLPVDPSIMAESMESVYEKTGANEVTDSFFDISQSGTATLVVAFDNGDQAHYRLDESIPEAPAEATISYLYSGETAAPAKRTKDMSIDDMAVLIYALDDVKRNIPRPS